MISKLMTLHCGNCKEENIQLSAINRRLAAQAKEWSDQWNESLKMISELKAMYDYSVGTMEREILLLKAELEKTKMALAKIEEQDKQDAAKPRSRNMTPAPSKAKAKAKAK